MDFSHMSELNQTAELCRKLPWAQLLASDCMGALHSVRMKIELHLWGL